jgi:coenzyme F420-reducing hydrogenase beta subunit
VPGRRGLPRRPVHRGLGQHDGWTLTIVRAQRGADRLRGATDARAIAVRPGEEDPAAIALLAKLAAKSRARALAAVASAAWRQAANAAREPR